MEKNFQIIQNKPNTENEIIIQKLEEKIKSLEERLLFDSPKNEKLMNITIKSGYQKIKYSLICKNTDKINDIEKMLYKKFPDFPKTENYFLCNGASIEKFKSLEENKIKDGDILLVYKFELSQG